MDDNSHNNNSNTYKTECDEQMTDNIKFSTCHDGMQNVHPQTIPANARSFNVHREDLNVSDDVGDRAAIFVWVYLIMITFLLIGAIIICCFVVVQYGFVVFVAVLTALSALTVVGVTLLSVIAGDAKLNKARATVDAWHIAVKETVFEEIDYLKEDLLSFSRGTLLLNYQNEDPGENPIVQNNKAETNDVDLDKKQHCTVARSENKPKSILFKYMVSPFTKNGSKKQSNNSRKSFSLSRKKTNNIVEFDRDNRAASPNYIPPKIV